MLPALLLAAAGAAVDARAALAADRWQEALAQARALAASDPSDADARTLLGEALYRAGLIEDAAAELTPLATVAAAPPRALAQLGLVRAAQGRDQEGSELLRRASDAAPDDPWVLFRAAGAAPTRARSVAILESYLAHADGEDPDRIESAKSTIRLYRALGERRVWVPNASPEHVELPLKPLVGDRAGRGWIIEATLAKNKKVRLLLDTGSTGLFVVARAVAKGGLEALSDETVFAGGGSGRTKSGRGILPVIGFGGVTFRDALVTTTTVELDPQGRIHGVVGLAVFAGYRATLDLAKGRLVLDASPGPSPGPPAGSPYWSVEGQMLVSAAAAGARDGLFLFDTGASRSTIGSAYASAVPGAQVTAQAAVHTYGGDVAGATTVRGVRLRFAGLETRGEPVTASDLTQRSRLGGVEISGFLGMDLLDGKIIVVDPRARRVTVSDPAAR